MLQINPFLDCTIYSRITVHIGRNSHSIQSKPKNITKMKIIVKTICLLMLINIPSLNAQNVFYDKVDSLLISASKLILNDLSKDSIIVLDRPWKGFGESYKFEVIFNDNRSIVLAFYNRPELSDPNKSISTHHFKYVMFRNYINENKELPYNKVNCLKYEFLLLQKKGETFGDAMFGEFKFKVAPEGLTIIDKKKEILTGEKSILEKHNSVW
jgi:hypothetical protein